MCCLLQRQPGADLRQGQPAALRGCAAFRGGAHDMQWCYPSAVLCCAVLCCPSAVLRCAVPCCAATRVHLLPTRVDTHHWPRICCRHLAPLPASLACLPAGAAHAVCPQLQCGRGLDSGMPQVRQCMRGFERCCSSHRSHPSAIGRQCLFQWHPARQPQPPPLPLLDAACCPLLLPAALLRSRRQQAPQTAQCSCGTLPSQQWPLGCATRGSTSPQWPVPGAPWACH